MRYTFKMLQLLICSVKFDLPALQALALQMFSDLKLEWLRNCALPATLLVFQPRNLIRFFQEFMGN